MNCAEVDQLLASRGSDALTPKRQRAVDEHLASCRDCRDAWAAYRRLMAEPVPVTPRELRHRVVGALLAARQAKPSQAEPRAARPLRLGVAIALLAGAAAASTWVYRVFEEERAGSSVVVDGDRAPTAAPSPGAEAAPVPLARRPSAAPPNGGAEGPNAAPAAETHPLDAYSVVVLAMPSPAISQEAAGYFEQCHDEALRELRTVDGLNVIAGAQVSPYGDSRRPPEDIGRELGAASVLVLSTASATAIEQMPSPPIQLALGSGIYSCDADLIDVPTSDGRVIAGGGGTWTADRPRRFAADVARGVRDALFEDGSASIARAQTTVLNAAAGDGRRAGALSALRRGRLYAERLNPDETQGMAPEPIPGAFTEAVVAAAATIGAASPDAGVREGAWRYLRGVRDPTLTQALVHSLASDGDARVRCQAALALGYLVDEPGVRSALLRATVEDPSTEPPARGCILSVRAAAQRALQSDDELRTASLRTVLDATLPSASRLAPLHQSIDGRGLPTVLDETAANAVFEIGRDSADARIRAVAWESLGSSVLPGFTPTLLEDLARHAAESVRAAAAAALKPYAEEMQVRAALEQARVDPSLVVRRAAQLALGAAGTE
jgi:HEAT repeat protein